MDVLFICPGLGIGGAERQWAVLLPELAARGLRVHVLALNHEGPVAADLRRAGIEVACANLSSRWDVAGVWRALECAHGDLDVVVTRSVNAHVVGSIAAWRARAAHVATEHTEYNLLPLRRHQRLLMHRVAPHTHAAICVAAPQIQPLVDVGYSRARIIVIPNAVRPEDMRSTRPRVDTRRELGIPDDAFLAVQLAALRPEKQPLDFVEAVRRAHSREPRVLGLLAGDGAERTRVDVACGDSGGAVRALGARRDVADILSAADVACLTSRTEAFPMALLEAMAVGRPIVATAVGGVSEMVIPGETGELVACGDVERFADELVRLARDPIRAAAMGANGRSQQAARFGFGEMVESYASVLERCDREMRARRVGLAVGNPERTR
jgi:glycosyltransferase involved in cell wall biosynthesis